MGCGSSTPAGAASSQPASPAPTQVKPNADAAAPAANKGPEKPWEEALDDPNGLKTSLITLMAQIITGEATQETLMAANHEGNYDYPTEVEEIMKLLWEMGSSGLLKAPANATFIEFICGCAIANLMHLTRSYPKPPNKPSQALPTLARDCGIVRKMFRIRQDLPVESLAQQLEIDVADVLFTQPVTNDPLVPPYAFVDDRNTGRLLVIFAGTRTFDTLGLPLSKANDVLPIQGGQVHKALMFAANAVFEKEGERLKALLAERAGYYIHILGHSTGGTVGALLGLLLRNSSGYRTATMQVTAFGPLPTMTYSLCDQCRDFCTSVVLQNDAFTRMSPQNVAEMYKRSEAMLAEVFDAVRLEVSNAGGSVGQQANDQLVLLIDDAIKSRMAHLPAPSLGTGADINKLYPPGRLLYLELPEGPYGGVASASEGDVRCGALEAVILRRSMFRHHRLQAYHEELEKIVAGAGNKTSTNTELVVSPSGRFY